LRESVTGADWHVSSLIKDVGRSTSKNVEIWQIRDLPALNSWTKGRAILIGDAAHASKDLRLPDFGTHRLMHLATVLPHRGAGATSAIEDAEAVAFALRNATAESAREALAHAMRIRYKRATESQAASRAEGLHAVIDLHRAESVLQAWAYPGADKWEQERPEMMMDA
jgi:salicylate hydroxylase